MGLRDVLGGGMLRGQRGKTGKEQGERGKLERGEMPARKSKPILNKANFEILVQLSLLWLCSDPFGLCRQHSACSSDPVTRATPFLTLAHCILPGAGTKPSQVCCWFSLKLQSSLDAASSPSVPPHRAQPCPKSWESSPGTAVPERCHQPHALLGGSFPCIYIPPGPRTCPW